MIRITIASDKEPLLQLATTSGQFDLDGIAHVRRTLDAYLGGTADALWLTADDGEAVAVAYCAPEPVTQSTWNLLMLWTRADRLGPGHGTALVAQMEREFHARGARLLIVETSALSDFEPARRFYAKCGFKQEATIKDFFAAGDDKIVLTKRLAQLAR